MVYRSNLQGSYVGTFISLPLQRIRVNTFCRKTAPPLRAISSQQTPATRYEQCLLLVARYCLEVDNGQYCPLLQHLKVTASEALVR